MDRVVETTAGYDIIVKNRRYGTWSSRAIASAAIPIEQARARKRNAAAMQQATEWEALPLSDDELEECFLP